MSLSTHKKHMENAGAIHRVLGGRSTILFYIYCTFFLSESDEFDEEVIYSQESPNMVEVYREILTGSWIDLWSTDYQLKKHFSF